MHWFWHSAKWLLRVGSMLNHTCSLGQLKVKVDGVVVPTDVQEGGDLLGLKLLDCRVSLPAHQEIGL